jgi:hypothetical protein
MARNLYCKIPYYCDIVKIVGSEGKPLMLFATVHLIAAPNPAARVA